MSKTVLYYLKLHFIFIFIFFNNCMFTIIDVRECLAIQLSPYGRYIAKVIY